jgi:hypothetical protein
MDELNNLFSVGGIIKIGGIVFSILSLVFTIQMYTHLASVTRILHTRANEGMKAIGKLLIFVSAILLLIAIFLL